MKDLAIHNSFSEYYRSPFGAVTVGSTVRLRLLAASVVNTAVLRLWVLSQEKLIFPESNEINENGEKLFEFIIKMPEVPGLVWYCFVIEGSFGKRCVVGGNGESCISQVGSYDNSYQITVYKESPNKAYFTNGIMYQIFPDRFCRGNSENSMGGLLRLYNHTNLGRQVYIHRDWNEEVLSKPLPNEKYYQPIDFFGGDLYGVIEMLPYLCELNVSIIYLNPIFSSPSNHRYDTADYLSCDEVLGGDAAAVLLNKACEKYSVSIMLDGVFSHTGADSVYFNKFNRYDSVGAFNSKESPYYGWYMFSDYPNEYKGWWGHKSLPEVDEDNESYRRFIKKVLKKWATILKASWRLDVADELTDAFICFLNSSLEEETAAYGEKKAVLLGEVWEDASNKHSKNMRRGYTDGNELDGVMNYPFRDNVIDFLLNRITAKQLSFNFKCLQENYPRSFLLSSTNILGSHDTERIMTVLGKKTLVKQAFVLQFVMPGVPCIYYGDEWGMEGGKDPFCRRPFKRNEANRDLFRLSKELSKIRASSRALKEGRAEYYALAADVFCVTRECDEEKITLIINRGESSYTAEAMRGKRVILGADSITVPKNGAVIWVE